MGFKKQYEFQKKGTHTFFGSHAILIFWHNVWSEKSMSSFFWNSYCFLDPILFSTQCLALKNMSSFFFGTHIFLEPIVFSVQC